MDEEATHVRSAVQLNSVSFSYGREEILKNINLDVQEGEFVVIVGESGSGKTTLLKVINKLLTGSGHVEVKGKVRMVFQQDRLFPWYTVYRNVAVAVGSADKKSRSLLVRRLLEEVKVDHLSERYPNELSGGERQRVSIVRAFAAEPNVVLMDEPFQNLDVLTKENMQAWLLNFWLQHKAAVVYVTHDVEEALMLGDRIALLTDGQLFSAMEVPFARPREQKLRYGPEFLRARQEIRMKLLKSVAKNR